MELEKDILADTAKERNALMKDVYPKLRVFCQELGYVFQVVDMRWGVRAASTDDHATTDLCLKELKACKKFSAGPFFVTFLGQKYGFRPFPTRIIQEEFEKMRASVTAKEELDILSTWFFLEANAVPPVYLLQPVSSVFPDFILPESEENQQKIAAARDAWYRSFSQLQQLLQKAALQCLDEERRLDYFMSVTENELHHGILDTPNRENRCFWFRRVITDLDQHESEKDMYLYKDMIDGRPDTEARLLLEKLRERLTCLPSGHTHEFSLSWSQHHQAADSNSGYLKSFCSKFEAVLREAIVKCHEERLQTPLVQICKDPTKEEIVSHITLARTYCTDFHGRVDTLSFLFGEYILHPSSHSMLYAGKAGVGLSSTMARVWHAAQLSLRSNVTVLGRFVGTSVLSSSVRGVLRSLAKQLASLLEAPPAHIPLDVKELLPCLENLISLAGKHKGMRYVFLVDAVNRFTKDSSFAYFVKFLTIELPENVKVIVSMHTSTMPDSHYARVRPLYDDASYYEETDLPYEDRVCILHLWLAKAGRTLTPAQLQMAEDALKANPNMLYANLVFNRVRSWHSYTPLTQCHLDPCIEGMINMLLDDIERRHGRILVSHALSYLTLANSGLSEPEIEDLLSLDDEVLDDVYQWWTPPLRRIPPLLWTRIRADLSAYLVEQGADDVVVLNWFYSAFSHTVRQRYLSKADLCVKFHRLMADYFLGSHSYRGKAHPRDPAHFIPRYVAKQPNKVEGKDGVVKYNTRRLSELPFHLSNANWIPLLRSQCTMNFEFLSCLVASKSASDALALFTLPGATDGCGRLIRDCLRLSVVVLNEDPSQLGPHLHGRLHPLLSTFPESSAPYDDLLNFLEASRSPTNIATPSIGCLQVPGSALTGIYLHSEQINKIALSYDSKVLVTAAGNNLSVWETGSYSLLCTSQMSGSITSLIMAPHALIAYITLSNSYQIHEYAVAKQRFERVFELKQALGTPSAIAVSPDGSWLYVSTSRNGLCGFSCIDPFSRQDFVLPEGMTSMGHLAATEHHLALIVATLCTAGRRVFLLIYSLSRGCELLHTLPIPSAACLLALPHDRVVVRGELKGKVLCCVDLKKGTLGPRFLQEREFTIAACEATWASSLITVANTKEQVWVYRCNEDEPQLVLHCKLPYSEESDVSCLYASSSLDLFFGLGFSVQQYSSSISRPRYEYPRYSQTIKSLAVVRSSSTNLAITYAAENVDDNPLRLWSLENGAVIASFKVWFSAAPTMAAYPKSPVLLIGHPSRVVLVDAERLTIVHQHVFVIAARDTLFADEDLDDDETEVDYFETHEDTPTIPQGLKEGIPSTRSVPRTSKTAPLSRFAGHSNDVEVLIPYKRESKFGFITGSMDKTIKIWCFESDDPAECAIVEETLSGHTLMVTCLVLHQESTLLSSALDTTVRIWDLRSYECLQVLSFYAPILKIVTSENFIGVQSSDEMLHLHNRTELMSSFSPEFAGNVTAVTNLSALGAYLCYCVHLNSGSHLCQVVSKDFQHIVFETTSSKPFVFAKIARSSILITASSLSLKMWALYGHNQLIGSFTADEEITCVAMNQEGDGVAVAFGMGPVTYFDLRPHFPQSRLTLGEGFDV